MHEEFLVKGVGRLAMPGSGPECVFKIAIKGFDVPAQVIEPGQFRSGKPVGVQEGRDQSTASKAVSVDEYDPNRQPGFIMIMLDLAEVISLGESQKHLRPREFGGRNDEMGLPAQDLEEGGAGIEAGIQEQQIAFLEALDQLANQFMFGSADLTVNETQRGTADQVKQATKLDGNSAQSLLTPVSAETFP